MNQFKSYKSFSFKGICASAYLALEIPLSILSFFFYKINRYFISRLYRRFLARSSTRSTTWRLLDRSTMEMPISLPVLMTTGPRWNTHALIGTIGPLNVSKSVAIRTSVCMQSADSWTGVVYRFPEFATVSQFSSLNEHAGNDWSSISLSPGRYILGIRYYGLSSQPRMPAVCVDDSITINGIETPINANQVYENLIDRSSFYYFCLHYYVYTLLRFRSLLPEAFVRREFLPVGDPDTVFRFGIIKARHYLNVCLRPELLSGYRCF